jgi:DNA-binding MarR family transcriptional regulator
MPDDPLVAHAIELSRSLGQSLHRHGGDRWYHVDLTLSQLRCLFLISDRAPISIGGVGRHLGIGLPSASGHVDRLVEQGLVRRSEDPVDRRRTLVSVTDTGAALAEQLRQGSQQALRDWLGALRRDDLAALVRGLEAVVRVAAPSDCPAAAGEASRNPAEEDDPPHPDPPAPGGREFTEG